MEALGSTNYYFLFQALLLYAEMTVGELHQGTSRSGFYHFHINCRHCLREISPIILNTNQEYNHVPVFEILNSWKPEGSNWMEKRVNLDLPEGRWWESKMAEEMSFHIGKTQVFLFGHLLSSRIGAPGSDKSLFPIVLRKKLTAYHYMLELIQGLILASSISSLYKRSIQNLRRPTPLLLGKVLFLIDSVSDYEGLINIWRVEKFLIGFIKAPHKIRSSYQLTNRDLGLLGRNFLKCLFSNYRTIKERFSNSLHEVLGIRRCHRPRCHHTFHHVTRGEQNPL